MAVEIQKDTIIGDILDIAPETAPILWQSVCTVWAARLPGEKPWKKLAWCMA